jgi:hypothetical protein
MNEEKQKRRERLEERVLIGSLYGLAGAATAVALALPAGGPLPGDTPGQDAPSVQPDQSATDGAGHPKLRERREALRKFVKTLDERDGDNGKNSLER